MMYRIYAENVLAQYQDGLKTYQAVLDRQVKSGQALLHLGCGHDIDGMVERYGSDCSVYGVDPDSGAIAKYPGVAFCASGEKLPFSDDVFDIVFSEYVLEHLDQPDKVFSEVSRVLSKNGRFISVTPNLWSYKSLVAHLTPLWFHKYAVRALRPDSPRVDDDVYATRYLANTKRDIMRLAAETGLKVEELWFLDNGPTWFQRIPVLFEIGRLVHALFHLRPFVGLRCNIVVMLRKSGGCDRREVAVRCTRCNREPMMLSEGSYICKDCGAKYDFQHSYWNAL